MNVYLLPGQGGDSRLFSTLKLPSGYLVKHIQYELPEIGVVRMGDYAKQLLLQIDQSAPFILIGVSLGGMLATELADICKPQKIIIISSAKHMFELPKRYRWFRYLPIHQLVPARVLKWSAYIAQPLVEPDRKNGKQVFLDMLKDLNYIFLKKGIRMILEWDRSDYDRSIIHIHGDKDNTLPYKRVESQYLIKGGSHMMVLTKGEEVSALISEILRDGKER